MTYRQNDIQKRALKEEQRKAAGLVSDIFPRVSSIVVDLSYMRKAVTPVFMKRTVYFYPDTYAYFLFDCMTKQCEKGGYDLTSVIGNIVEKKKDSAEGEMDCKGKGPNLSNNHTSILYKVQVEYKK